jgi:putative DNA primase/helicase
MKDDLGGLLELRNLQENGALSPAAEDAIALLFAERHGDGWRYIAAWGQWMSFDGTHWRRDETLHAFDLARDICREIALEGNKPSSAVASAKTVAAVERLAKADRRLAATAEQWDASDWVLNAD